MEHPSQDDREKCNSSLLAVGVGVCVCGGWGVTIGLDDVLHLTACQGGQQKNKVVCQRREYVGTWARLAGLGVYKLYRPLVRAVQRWWVGR